MNKLRFLTSLDRRTVMKVEESKTDFGIIRIHKKVIASIASLAALEIEGVKRVGGDFKSSLPPESKKVQRCLKTLSNPK